MERGHKVDKVFQVHLISIELRGQRVRQITFLLLLLFSVCTIRRPNLHPLSLPSFHPLNLFTDILKGKTLSPITSSLHHVNHSCSFVQKMLFCGQIIVERTFKNLIYLNVEQGWMIQWPDSFCRNRSFINAFLLPNNFMANLLSEGWNRASIWFRMKDGPPDLPSMLLYIVPWLKLSVGS